MIVTTSAKIIYPDRDGQPMSDNTKQFRWIVTIKENLELLFAQDPNVFIAGDLLWYPVEGNNTIQNAPDTMVVFGKPKGDRGSYYRPDGAKFLGFIELDEQRRIAQERATRLAAKLRELGVDPDSI